jgi:cystathionine beta-lyase
VDHEIFGYTHIPDSYYEAAIGWWQRRRGWHTEKEWYTPVDGIVPGMSIVMYALTHYEVNDEGKVVEKPNCGKGPNGELPKVIIQSPAYNCFFSSVRNIGCELSANKLIYDTEGDQATWYIDFEDLERRAADPMAKVLLFCNPHNPCGRVWPKEDLQKVAEICRRNGVIVVSDEIHCEFAFPGHTYTPFANIAIDDMDFCVCMSASKAFNIACLLCATIYVPNKELFAQINHALEINEVNGLNPFGLVAQVAAYNESEDWLDELNEYVYGNFCFLRDFIHAELPMLQIHETEGTYLGWVNISALGMSAEEFCCNLAKKGHVLFNPSEMYGGEKYVRINLATSREVLEQAMNQCKDYILSL